MVATNADDRRELNAYTRTARAVGKKGRKTSPVRRRSTKQDRLSDEASADMDGGSYSVRKMITSRSFAEKSCDGFMQFSYSHRLFSCLSW